MPQYLMQAMLVGADTVSMIIGSSDMVVSVVSALVAVAYVVVFKYDACYWTWLYRGCTGSLKSEV